MSFNEHHGIVIYPNENMVNEDINRLLPMREGPIRFAVIDKNGLRSNSWSIKCNSLGDIYIACRDSIAETKISLHKSGEQHIAVFTKESHLGITPCNLLWQKWVEPMAHNHSKVIPSFELLFPNWALGLNDDDLQANHKMWRKNNMIIGAADSDLITMVSFFIVDEGLDWKQDNLQLFRFSPLGIIRARAGKALWVIAHQKLGTNLKHSVESFIQTNGREFGSQRNETHEGEVRSACLTGLSSEGGGFMIVVPDEAHLM